VFSNLPGIKIAEPWPPTWKLQQLLGCLAEFVLDFAGTNGIISRNEVRETVDIAPGVVGPYDTQAARVARERALRLSAKCLSTSS
jgi:hypothetical protein